MKPGDFVRNKHGDNLTFYSCNNSEKYSSIAVKQNSIMLFIEEATSSKCHIERKFLINSCVYYANATHKEWSNILEVVE